VIAIWAIATKAGPHGFAVEMIGPQNASRQLRYSSWLARLRLLRGLDGGERGLKCSRAR
jgi:hypothetical protein